MALSMATANSAARTEVLMFRKLMFVLCAMSLTLASCGRQVTPNRSGTSGGGPPSGFIQIKFTTAQAMDFVNVWYVIAVNTEGAAAATNGEPYPINANQNQNWLNYSFEIIVFQTPGQTGPQAALIQFLTAHPAGSPPIKYPSQPFVLTPQQLLLTPNCNGQQTQFCLLIDRNVFAGLLSNSPTPSASPSGSPSASPSASPSGSPSASPSPTPSGSPAPPTVTGSWYFNWFTVTSNAGGPGAASQGQIIDAPGTLGVNDQSWTPPNSPYNTATSFDVLWNAVPSWPQVSSGAAQIAGGEVLNTP